MSYIVIFEKDESTGGCFGTRTKITYSSQAEFEAATKLSTERIVAEGITEAKSLELLYTVPPICHLMAAVETAFTNVSNIPDHLELYVNNALIAILSDRQYLRENGLSPQPVNMHYYWHYKSMTMEATAKAAIVQVVLGFLDYQTLELNELALDYGFIQALKTTCAKAIKMYSHL